MLNSSNRTSILTPTVQVPRDQVDLSEPVRAGIGEPGGQIALSAVEETMLIPLWARAAEHLHPDPILRDPLARHLAQTLPFDFHRFEGAWKSQVGVAVRSRWIDHIAKDFIVRKFRATESQRIDTGEKVIVTLGAGLDTRFDRIDDGHTHWIDIDLPGAIQCRSRYMPDRARNIHLPHALDEFRWIETLNQMTCAAMGRRTKRVLFIAEGVLMFLPRQVVREMIALLARSFPGSEMIFDMIGGLMVKVPRLHDSLKRTDARFVWGLGGRRDLDRLTPGCLIHSRRSMLDEAPRRWRWMQPLRCVPIMRRQFTVVHLQFPPKLPPKLPPVADFPVATNRFSD